MPPTTAAMTASVVAFLDGADLDVVTTKDVFRHLQSAFDVRDSRAFRRSVRGIVRRYLARLYATIAPVAVKLDVRRRGAEQRVVVRLEPRRAQ